MLDVGRSLAEPSELKRPPVSGFELLGLCCFIYEPLYEERK